MVEEAIEEGRSLIAEGQDEEEVGDRKEVEIGPSSDSKGEDVDDGMDFLIEVSVVLSRPSSISR